ncbi:MAG: hypothetical protein L3K23_10725, partial [Thermoplasmata archaeon]|nr:hypothetical protein [Thermoplasmata archaeon]
YNVEVECSTLVKHLDQVARNIRKAAGAGRRCLVVVSDRAMAERFVGVLESDIQGTRLWGEVGLLTKDANGELAPFEDGLTAPWGWLVGRDEPTETDDDGERIEPLVESDEIVEVADVERALHLSRILIANGRLQVTSRDFLVVAEPDEAVVADLRRLGMALRSLGVRSRRLRENGGRDRVYDLRQLNQQRAGPSA